MYVPIKKNCVILLYETHNLSPDGKLLPDFKVGQPVNY